MSQKILAILFFCLAIICQTAAFGQTQTVVSEPTKVNEINVKFPGLKKQADEMAKAIMANDFDKFADFMYPKLIAAAGGKAKFVANLKTTMARLKSSGIESGSYTVGDPTQTVDLKNQIFSILPTETTVKTENGTITMAGGLLGISEDGGKNWTFVRIESKEALKRLFPEVADKLTLPVIGIK